GGHGAGDRPGPGVQPPRRRGVGRRLQPGGLDALPDRPHSGRTPTLPHAQEARFLERIDAAPYPEDGVCELRGADIRRISDEAFGARYSLSGVYSTSRSTGSATAT